MRNSNSTFLYLYSFVLLFPLFLNAQLWTDPVVVSNDDGYNMHTNMCIDNNGVIHIVWSHRITGKFWKIMYSKSLDNGETWTEDLDISQNDTLWLSQPNIAFDSENNLYITYDYDTYSPSKMLVYLQIFNGIEWSEPILISDGMSGSDYNKLIVDNENKLIVGWYRDSKFYYRFYNNTVFSDVYCPYCDSTDIFLPVESALTSDKIVKWIGASYSFNYIGSRLQYYEHDLNNNSWTAPQMLDSNKLHVGVDISLDDSNNPKIVYRIETSVWPNPFSDATYYKNYDGQQWSDAELIVDDPKNQQIAIDQFNRPHITDREKTVTGQQLVHYSKNNNEWIGYIIDSSGNMVNDAKLLFYNNCMYLTYFKSEVPGDLDSDVLFTKYDVVTNIPEAPSPITNFKIYPNPISESATFEFIIEKKCNVQAMIFSISGQLVTKLITKNLGKGKHKLTWNVSDNSGKSIESGIYLCRLYAGRYVITKSFEIIK